MDEREFAARVKARERQLYRVAFAMMQSDADAADAVQEALVSAWLHIGSLREAAFFETWLTRILINECKRLMRKRFLRPLPIAEVTPTAPAPDMGLRQALSALSPNDRMALVLKHVEGYSIEEIAHMLRLPGGTVKSRLSRARTRLKALLEKEE